MTYTEMKEKATDMGLEFAGNIKKEELEQLIKDAEENEEIEAKMASYELPKEEVKVDKPAKKVNHRMDAMKLIKCVITPLADSKRNLTHEMFSVGNAQVGFIKKVVSLGVETFEPTIIVKNIKQRKMVVAQKKTVDGKEVIVNKRVPAYNIIEMEITAEDIEAAKQPRAK
jgi:hypothetical protein